MDHLWVMFLLKPPFLGDVPLPCLITKGYLVPCGHQTWQGRSLWAKFDDFRDPINGSWRTSHRECSPCSKCLNSRHSFCLRTVLHPSIHRDIHQWHRHPPVTAVTTKSGLDRSRVTGSMALSRLEDMAMGPWGHGARCLKTLNGENIPMKCCKWEVEDSWNMLKILKFYKHHHPNQIQWERLQTITPQNINNFKL